MTDRVNLTTHDPDATVGERLRFMAALGYPSVMVRTPDLKALFAELDECSSSLADAHRALLHADEQISRLQREVEAHRRARLAQGDLFAQEPARD